MSGSVGFRGLESVFSTLKEWFTSLATPVYGTIRQWISKLGLFKLERPKVPSEAWFLVIDTSIQMGQQKFVLVLGVRQEQLTNGFCPTHAQMEPIVLRPLESCPGDIICDVLQEARTKVGIPLAIVSDSAGELRRGVSLFCESLAAEKVPEQGVPVHLHDISHRVDTCLKHELESDLTWNHFKKQATEVMQQVKLSPISHLAPPRQRAKARMHASHSLIHWGIKMIRYLESDADRLPPEQRKKIAWILEYRDVLKTYDCLVELCRTALNKVHEKGYYNTVAADFIAATASVCSLNPRHLQFQKKVKSILEEEGSKVPEGQHYLGSSEVIESVFGKFNSFHRP